MADAQGRPAVSVRSVNCPNCGAATAVRTFGHAVNVVCQSCGSILDAKDPGVTILQEYKKAVRYEPLIPLGTRGKILKTTSASGPQRDADHEVVGFQVRQILVDGVAYEWSEYLLFNPYYGFHYLTEYGGHWNVVTTLRSLPEGGAKPSTAGSRSYYGQTYRHFQTANARTVFVLGEFPWQVRVGETATVADYVAPPRLLSAEMTADKEATWSLGEYVDGADIWSTLSLPGAPPAREGVFADQPSPFGGGAGRMWRSAALLIALAILLWVAHLATARQKVAFAQAFTYDPRGTQDTSFVTPVFELDGRPSAVRVETSADLDNQWVGVGFALVNDDSGQTYEFAREVSYYHGVDEGESWSEGSRADDVTLSRIPSGRYFLRIEPEGDRAGRPVRYRVRVIRDVATSIWFVAALVLIVIPPIAATWRSATFERRRWAESDHGPADSSNHGDDDDE
jgi:ribosomal protein S27E